VLGRPALADREIAAATFKKHLDEIWDTSVPRRRGWRRVPIDALHEVVFMPATRADGIVDDYYVLLGAEYYDFWPPTAAFVVPETWQEATSGSRWFPALASNPGWFALHTSAGFPEEYALNGSRQRQLVCFSGTAQYYMVDHAPPDTAVWKQGERTVSMTLSRLQEVLRQPYYAHPSRDAE
jgi:hypothetical protein